MGKWFSGNYTEKLKTIINRKKYYNTLISLFLITIPFSLTIYVVVKCFVLDQGVIAVLLIIYFVLYILVVTFALLAGFNDPGIFHRNNVTYLYN